MRISVYADGSGGPDAGYGYLVKETGESAYKTSPGLTNNQAEYMAIIAILEDLGSRYDDILVYSDSLNTVRQLNHEFAINNKALRELAMTAWRIMAGCNKVRIEWVPRRENIAGKMLGS